MRTVGGGWVVGLGDPVGLSQPLSRYDPNQYQAAQRGCGCPIPGGVQGRVGWALGSLSCWEAALLMAGGWNWVGFKVPSNLSHFVIL